MAPTFVILHAAWHVPEHYSSLVEKLQGKGFEVHIPRNPSSGPLSPTTGLADDVKVVRDLVSNLAENNKEIIVIAHSYGGVIATEALGDLSAKVRKGKNLPGGVVHLIYLAAFMLQPEESVLIVGQPRPEQEPLAFKEDGTVFFALPPRKLLFLDVEENAAKKAEEMLVQQAAVVFVTQVTNAAWKYIPTTYVECTEDELLFPKWQHSLINNVRNSGTELAVKTFKSSHSPQLSIPDEIVATASEIAEKSYD